MTLLVVIITIKLIEYIIKMHRHQLDSPAENGQGDSEDLPEEN